MERYSTENKIFYAEEGHEDEEMPDNISIEVGTNRYGADEHEKFREAILRQLAVQLQSVDAELTGDGTFTEQDYIVYIFTIHWAIGLIIDTGSSLAERHKGDRSLLAFYLSVPISGIAWFI